MMCELDTIVDSSGRNTANFKGKVRMKLNTTRQAY